jgi:hypothetical protein
MVIIISNEENITTVEYTELKGLMKEGPSWNMVVLSETQMKPILKVDILILPC